MNPATVEQVEPAPIAEPASAAEGVEALFRAHGDELVGMLWVFVGDRALAEDLAQEAFVRLFGAWDRLDDTSRAVGYLRATAFNLARAGFRRARLVGREAALGVSEAADDLPEWRAVLRDDQQQVIEALRGLAPRQRECLVLRFWAEMSGPEIAEALQISANSVKTHTRRGLRGLERHLKEPR